MKLSLTIFSFVFLVTFDLLSQAGQGFPVPRPGDTLYRGVDVMPPKDVVPTWTGEMFQWNYSRLLSPFVHKVSVTAPGRIGDYCEAPPEIALTDTDGIEYFLYSDAQGLWVSGIQFEAQGRRWLAIMADKFPYRLEPRALTENEGFEGRIEVYPMLDASNGLDQSRERILMDFQVECIPTGSEGVMTMPRGQFRVMEVQHDYRFDVSYQVKSQDQWTDQPPASVPALPRALQDHVDVIFWSADYPDAVLIDRRTQDYQSGSVEYRILPFGIPEYPGRTSQEDVFVYPNPSYGQVRFDFVNLDPGNYSLEIYNILGVKLREEKLRLNGSKTVQFDFSDLRKGTYIYRLVDGSYKTIRSKRLVIVEP